VNLFERRTAPPQLTGAQPSAAQLTLILQLLEYIMTALTDLQTQVAANTSVEGSALALIQGLASQLTAAIAASPNPDSSLVALSAQLSSSATALAAAVVANTPAAPGGPAAGTTTP